MYKEIVTQTNKEIIEAKKKGYAQCQCCRAYKPLVTGDCLCFRCHVHFRLDKEPEEIEVWTV